MHDALTSKRPDKETWSNEQAFAEMFSQALDPKCVQAPIGMKPSLCNNSLLKPNFPDA